MYIVLCPIKSRTLKKGSWWLFHCTRLGWDFPLTISLSSHTGKLSQFIISSISSFILVECLLSNQIILLQPPLPNVLLR